ncbi:putative non-specific serine/threonine protein kinase [Helianthus annuus]|uniref:Non-specific serine/threonine protein kinase n=1 Tax=Helianthus annuus TaxID=4232 RepID=A0A251U394_HELAN|nr:putative non-specific serine/threonine protein kinase [Helianthus annuus]KAJ0552667.1 putative non-specific serine/threonine protein kinase [Helianthus annuus]KAJ0721597.1 putative non-specific serine/threonine protein kinase [Helianthus annuus]KAJ0896814.1 putative non-specific serine/threonine protein kinase [Helianthus annuus]
MLEMMTGLRVLDPNRPPSQQNLVDWARPSLTDIKKLKGIMDLQLEQHYPSQGVIKAGELIRKCLDVNPNHRPSMEKVVASLEEINAIRMKPKRLKINNGNLMSLHHEQRYGDHRRENCHRSPLHAKQRVGV